MALTTEEATYNTAVLAAIAALEAMVDAKTAGNQIQMVPLKIEQVGMPHRRWANDGATLQWDFAQKAVFTRELPTADRFPTQANGKPLFWLCTNAAGDLT